MDLHSTKTRDYEHILGFTSHPPPFHMANFKPEWLPIGNFTSQEEARLWHVLYSAGLYYYPPIPS